ncbi:MAG TPA: DUF2971 domain-containing protein [Longimicrobium sp.]
MAFERHPAFTPAPNPESRLWRYMSVPKYLSLIQRSGLFLSSLELMALTDPFEGSLPLSKFRHRDWNSREDIPEQILPKLPGYFEAVGLKHYRDLVEHDIRRSFAFRRSYFINCWHINEHESAAMWDIYSRRDEGIAIVSSESRIESALIDWGNPIYGGCVTYGDYMKADLEFDEWFAFTPILHKRVDFAYEKEYRLVYWDSSVTHKDGSGSTLVERELKEIEQQKVVPGHYVSCDLRKMIEAIYVSPLAKDWFLEIVTHVSESAGLPTPIKSELLAEPLR